MRIALFFICLIFLACNKPESNCLKSAGEITTISKSISAASELQVFDNVHVELYDDNHARMEISFPENLIDGITATNKDGVLRVDNQNRCRWLKDLSLRPKIKLFLPFEELETVVHYGAESLSFKDTMRVNGFTFEQWDAAGDSEILYSGKNIFIKQNTGPANITVTGKSDYLYIYNTSLGFTDARKLKSDRAYLLSNSVMEINAQAINHCDLEIYGKGNISLCPEPISTKLVKQGLGEMIICP